MSYPSYPSYLPRVSSMVSSSSDTSVDLLEVSQMVANSFRHTGKDPDELLSSAWMGVQKGKEVWKEGKSPEQAFLYLCGRSSVLDQLRQEARQAGSAKSLDTQDTTSPEFQFTDLPSIQLELSTMLDEARVSNTLYRDLAHSAWVDNKSASRISRETGLSTWTVQKSLGNIRDAISRNYLHLSD